MIHDTAYYGWKLLKNWVYYYGLWWCVVYDGGWNTGSLLYLLLLLLLPSTSTIHDLLHSLNLELNS